MEYLSEEFSGEQLISKKKKKKKRVFPYGYMDNFKKSFEDKLPDKCEFYSSLKD